MDKEALENKLESIRTKQEKLENAWAKTGNKELLQFFIDILPKVLDVERCSIFILDPEEDRVWLQCGTGLEEKQVTVPTRGSIVGTVISTGKPVADMEMEASVGEHDVISMKTGFIARDTLCVPVFGVSTDRVTGAIQVLNKRGASGYTNNDKQLLDRLAYQLQMNIESIFLRQEMAKISEIMKKKIEKLERMLKK
ncbi:MAG TPA: GAF domain-containing protein [Gammaproteobacteria bacterium]|mgnify:CR=1 FL=1|nr:GAF domain-containing protein [Gammaproteobacteria bacterium]